MAMTLKYAITPTREEDYPQWYQNVISAADLAEISPVRGCMVIKPWGYAIWENMQHVLDGMFKDTGHVNAYFPLFIPLSYLEKEAEHVEGFAKECAVVTHHRLKLSDGGGLMPDPEAELTEPLIVRPTSETIIGATYAKWVHSYRDLPILINQWANVVRWEMRTRLFLRTSEFLWQEGHTAHTSEEEARAETMTILNLYTDFAESYMAMPVIKGEKTPGERFPGAVSTYSIEAMMQDRKALQAGTSHFLGQNFSRAQDLKFHDKDGHLKYAWTTSWGISTRLIGALIMTHSDDNGLVLPPRLAPKHIVVLPIYRNEEQRSLVLAYCESLKRELEVQGFAGSKIRVMVDDRDIPGGEKTWQYIKRGVPLRVEIGPREVTSESISFSRRDREPKERISVARNEFIGTVNETLENIQRNLFQRALDFRKTHTRQIDSLEDFQTFFTAQNPENPEIHAGFALCHWTDDPAVHKVLEELKVTIRCIPLDETQQVGTCIFTGKRSQGRAIFAKAY